MSKIEFIFEAGVWYQKKPLSSSVTNSLLSSGTKNLTEQQIAEKIDFYGAYISLQSDRDYATITLFTLNKYLKEFSTILTTAHQGLENNVSGLNDITEELTEQIEKMTRRR